MILLNGYVPDSRVRKRLNDRDFEVTTFQGEHSDEYIVKEGRSGECRLFRKGVLELSWKEEEGKKVGGFAVYERGKALRRESWKSFLSREEHRYVENDPVGLKMTIRKGEKGVVVYRGGFDNEASMQREGDGYAYDEESGRVLVHGVWRKDELFQILQEFESESEMIEYALMRGEENVSVLNRRPVYEGGYVYDESKKEYVRHGEGNVISIDSGVAINECEWSYGELKKSVELFDGWYVKGEEESVIVREEEKEEGNALRVEIHSELEWNSLDRSVGELVVCSSCCDEASWKTLDLGELKSVRRVEIGDECFMHVEEVKLVGLKKLESVVIGENCFTKKKNAYGKNPNRHFCLKDCPKLKELKVGRYSFSDYTVCEIESVDALEVIEMGRLNYVSCNFFSASLELKSGRLLKA